MNWNIEPTTRRRLTLNLDSFPTIFPVDLMTIMICASIVGSITGHSRHGKSGSAKTQTPNWFWTVSGNYLSLVELESSSWYGCQAILEFKVTSTNTSNILRCEVVGRRKRLRFTHSWGICGLQNTNTWSIRNRTNGTSVCWMGKSHSIIQTIRSVLDSSSIRVAQ